MSWGKLAIGVLFLAMARRSWRSRPKAGDDPKMPAWMADVDGLGPVKALGLGVALSGLNPKNLALAAAAAAIAQAGLDAASDTVGIAVFVVLGSVTVVGAVLFSLMRAEHGRSAAGVDQDVHVRPQLGDHDGHPVGARREADR